MRTQRKVAINDRENGARASVVPSPRQRIEHLLTNLVNGGHEPAIMRQIASIAQKAADPQSESAELRYYTLEQCLADHALLAPPMPVISPLVYEGRVTLLSAREKMGKSTIAGQAVAALTQGRTFLNPNETLSPANVVWYAIDEALPDTVQRLKAFGAKANRVFLCDGLPTPDEMERAIERHKAKLVVVDTLSELWAGKLENDRDAIPMALYLRPFLQVARRTGAGQLLSYHTSRAGREYRGSVQLGASVDAPLTLRFPASAQRPHGAAAETDEEDERSIDEPRRVLTGRTRWGKVFLRLTFNGSLYQLSGGVADPIEQQRKLRALQAIREGVRSGTALQGALSMRRDVALKLSVALQAEGLAHWSKTEKGLVLTEMGERMLDNGAGSQRPEPGTAQGTSHTQAGSRLTERIGGNRSDDDRGEAWEPQP